MCRKATRLLVAVHLRNILGTQTLSEIMSERDRTIKSLIEEISKTTEPWGVRHALARILRRLIGR